MRPEAVGNESVRITAELPDGSVEPLLWLYRYQVDLPHPFLLETPLELPRGTRILGVPEGTSVILLPGVGLTPATYTGPPFVANRPPDRRMLQ